MQERNTACYDEDENSPSSRTRYLLGQNALFRLESCHVALFGLGGVGGYVAEALVRAGIKTLSIFDYDKINLSNLNRQIIATKKTIGQLKTFALKDRLESISNATIIPYNLKVDAKSIEEIKFNTYSYIIDAIDDITAKILLIKKAKALNLPLISCMGMGRKIEPLKIKVDDISKTSVCPLARAVRTRLKKEGISKVKVAYSTEPPLSSCQNPSAIPSISFLPMAAGAVISSEVVKDLCHL